MQRRFLGAGHAWPCLLVFRCATSISHVDDISWWDFGIVWSSWSSIVFKDFFDIEVLVLRLHNQLFFDLSNSSWSDTTCGLDRLTQPDVLEATFVDRTLIDSG